MRATLLAVALALLGCGTRGTLYNEELHPLPLIATSSAVVLVVPQTQRAVVLTPGKKTPVGLKIGKGAHFAVQVPGTDLVAILDGTPKAPKLDLVETSTGKVETLSLPGFFDSLRFSPDGRFGVLVFGAAGSNAVTARNLNEIGLLTMTTRTVTRIQLDAESVASAEVLFAPAEPGRQLVAMTLERGVALFDALHPEIAARRISIRPQGSSAEIAVLETLFSRDVRHLFLRASGLDDVIVVELGTQVGQPLSASINFVSGGTGLSDIELPPPGFEGSVLAVYSSSREAFLLDATGIADNVKKLSLAAPVTQIRLTQGSRALLWDVNSRTVSAWDVADGRSGSAVLDDAFGGPTVVQSLDQGLFPSSAALSVATVVGETNRLRLRIQAIQLAAQLGVSQLDEAGSRLFFAVSGSRALVTMNLKTLQLSEVTLDAAVKRVFHLTQADWLVVDHDGPLGDVTVIPAGSTDRSAALRYSDFALTDDLDRPGDAP